jgi:medium-chain acyl-[acyl-carrier-protein] hydrolase
MTHGSHPAQPSGNATATDWFIATTAAGLDARRVYALPHAGGGCATFTGLADVMSPDTAIWALNLPGRQARFLEPPRTALEPLIADLSDALDGLEAQRKGGGGPVLFGYCAGALLAFLIARRLRRSVGAPAALVVASSAAPDLIQPARVLHTFDSDTFWSTIMSYGGVPPRVAAEPEFRDIFERSLRADHELLSRYRYADEPPLDIPLTVLVGEDDPVLRPADIDGWRRHTTCGMTIRRLPGDHWLLDTAPGALAEEIEAAARAAGQTIDDAGRDAHT